MSHELGFELKRSLHTLSNYGVKSLLPQACIFDANNNFNNFPLIVQRN